MMRTQNLLKTPANLGRAISCLAMVFIFGACAKGGSGDPFPVAPVAPQEQPVKDATTANDSASEQGESNGEGQDDTATEISEAEAPGQELLPVPPPVVAPQPAPPAVPQPQAPGPSVPQPKPPVVVPQPAPPVVSQPKPPVVETQPAPPESVPQPKPPVVIPRPVPANPKPAEPLPPPVQKPKPPASSEKIPPPIKKPEPPPAKQPEKPELPPAKQPETPPPAASSDGDKADKSTPEWVYRAAPWSRVKNSRAWTNAALRVIRARMSDLERARDKEDFCPHYSTASRVQREVCWLRLVGALAKYESSFKPTTSFQEPDGNWSVGLMALSPGECRSMGRTVEELQDAVGNLTCGINKLAGFIGRHGFINGPKSSRGAAAYWSTLREPYQYGKYKLGKRGKIIHITRTYRTTEGDPNRAGASSGNTTKRPSKDGTKKAASKSGQ